MLMIKVNKNIVIEDSVALKDLPTKNWVDNEINSFLPSKVTTFNNEWRIASKATGAVLNLTIPIYNPKGTAPTLNFTSAQIYDGSGWYNLGYPTINWYNTTSISLDLNNSYTLNIQPYLVRLIGTITCQ